MGIRDVLKMQEHKGEFLIKSYKMETLLQKFDEILFEMNLKVKRKSSNEDDASYLAIYGDRLSSTLARMAQIGRLTELGKLQGVKIEITRYEDDLALELSILPFTELFDDQEYYLPTQIDLEGIFDGVYSKKMYDEILQRLTNQGVQLISGIPKEYKELAEKSPFKYLPLINKYELYLEIACPNCKYEYTGRILVVSKGNRSANTICPRCNQKSTVTLEL